jgi:hypothetical protein
MALASPGVLIKEVDFTATVQVADQNIAVVAIDAEKGPTDVVTYISSERELVEIFGTPNNFNFESWFAANTIIQYGGIVAVIRPTGGVIDLGLNNANVKTAGTYNLSLLIQNKDQYQTLTSGQKDFLFAARTAGESNNGISVAVIDHGADQRVTVTLETDVTPAVGQLVKWTVNSVTYTGNVYKVVDADSLEITLWDTTKRLFTGVDLLDVDGDPYGTVTAIESDDVYDTLEYAPGRRWITIGAQPGTSQTVSERGGKFDELHAVIIDTDGTVSGNPGTVLETLTYLSKASDAKSTEGATTFWKKVIEDQSRYIYAGDNDIAGALELLSLDGQPGTSSNPGSASANATFKLFNYSGSPTKSWKLGEGSNYDYGTGINSSEYTAVKSACVSAYDLVRDPESFGDIDFLVPGVITDSAIVRLVEIAESRRDCIVVASPKREDVINSNTNTAKTDAIVSFFRKLPSSSFAMFDSGYKYIYDKYNDVYRYVPCAADVAGICINTTINSETWFSPAGYNRGNLRNATKLAYSPRQSERDRLYINRINPVVSFPGQGIVLFGDKTALSSPSAFDRINVRRLFIELEKNIARFSKYQLFEINDELTRSGFKAAVEPYLRGVQGRRGIYDFLVVCDTSNNTPGVIDRNEFQAEIYIKPARSINFITITFVATRTGVSFNELTV